jgi:uncharacterized protein (TIGR02246 family)
VQLDDDRATDDGAIRSVIDDFARAVRERNVDAMLAHCADDVVVFDMLPPLKHAGVQAVRRNWTSTLEAFRNHVDYEVSQLHIFARGDMALCHSLNYFGGARKTGQRSGTWLRQTLGLRRIDGHWKLAHQHISVPLDMEAGTGLLDLQP